MHTDFISGLLSKWTRKTWEVCVVRRWKLHEVKDIILLLLANKVCYYSLYNDVNATRVLIGRRPWSIRVQIHGWRHAKLAFFVSFNMARGFENVCGINSDKSKWNPRKKFHWSYLQERKMEKRGQKELLSTLQSLNYQKSSQQLPACFIAMRDSPFCKMFSPLFCFEQEKTLKNFSKKLYKIKIKKKRRSRDEK